MIINQENLLKEKIGKIKADTFYQPLVESSLNRLVKHISEHDCGTISAYRSNYKLRENEKRNLSLKAKLLSAGYGVTAVDGIFVENYNTPQAVEVSEETFFVVDLRDKKFLKGFLEYLGDEFEQDSILWIPKGIDGGSYLVGTSPTGAYPGKGNEIHMPILRLGRDNNEFLTRVKGRPLYFKESGIISEDYAPNAISRAGWNHLAKKPWNLLEDKYINK